MLRMFGLFIEPERGILRLGLHYYTDFAAKITENILAVAILKGLEQIIFPSLKETVSSGSTP